MGGQELSTYRLPVPTQNAGERLAREYQWETNYIAEEQGLISSTNQENITVDQLAVFQQFMSAVDRNKGWFLHTVP